MERTKNFFYFFIYLHSERYGRPIFEKDDLVAQKYVFYNGDWHIVFLRNLHECLSYRKVYYTMKKILKSSIQR